MQNILKTLYPCDMHCHTTRSDGKDAPWELIQNAAALGMSVVAITDHDTAPPLILELPNGRQVESHAYAAELGLQLVLGDEFSTNTWVDETHICGYELDWSHPAFLEEVEAARRSKTEAYAELCDRLTGRGMPVDWEADVLTYRDSKGQVQRRNPDEVERKHIFETMARKAYAENWSAAKLLVRDDPELNVRRRKIDPIACINLIHQCGGLAVLAHPYLIDETILVPGRPPQSRADYIEELIEAGLDGIEASYTYDKTTYKGSLSPEEIEAEVRRTYAGRVRFISGGSDYHGKQGKSPEKERQLGERGLSLAEFVQLLLCEPLRTILNVNHLYEGV